MKKQKWLKIAKISLITLLCITCLALPIFAVYTSGDYNTPRYYAPLRFDFEIFGTTAQLTPTISYKSGQTLTYDTTETATQGTGSTAVLNSISRTNFAVSTLADNCLDVSYRLKFNINESVDNFTMRITNDGGIYDFAKYGVPQIAVPSGYTATSSTMYSLRFTQSQSSNVNVANVTINGDYSNDLNIPLLRTNYTLNGTDYDIVGGVIVEDYITEITFTKEGSQSGSFGSEGYYLWNTVLTDPAGYFTAIFGMSTEQAEFLYYEFEDYFVVDYVYEGVAYSYEFNKFIFVALNENPINFRYDDDVSDFGYIVYNFNTDEWLVVDVPNDAEELEGGATINNVDIRCIRFDSEFNSYNSWNVRFGYDTDFIFGNEYGEPAISTFLDYMESNTIRYDTNPLQTVVNTDGVTYSFTDGDGGMYLHYYVDPSLNLEYNQTMKDLYDYGVTVGYGNGGGHNTQFTSMWIGNAVKGVMEVEIFPNFTIGAVLGAIVSLGITVALLKFFAGG